MDKKDLAQIKLGSPAFTSKWWKDKRADATKGAGVLKALDDWQKACSKDPEKMPSPAAAEAASKAARQLIAAMTKAKAKAAKDKDCADACALYIKLAGGYLDKIAAPAAPGPAPASTGGDDKELARVQALMAKTLAAVKASAAKGGKMTEAVAVVSKALAKVTALANARTQGKAGRPVAELNAQLDKIGAALKEPGRYLGQLGGLRKMHKEVMAAASKLRAPAAVAATRAFDQDFDKLMAFENRLEAAIRDTDRELDEARAIVNRSDMTLDSVRASFGNFHDSLYDHIQTSLHDMPVALNAITAAAVEVLKTKARSLDPAAQTALREKVEDLAESFARLDRIAASHASDGASMRKVVRGFEKEADFAKELPKLDKDLAAMRNALKNAEKAMDAARKVAANTQSV